jgi:hypothetical protein
MAVFLQNKKLSNEPDVYEVSLDVVVAYIVK